MKLTEIAVGVVSLEEGLDYDGLMRMPMTEFRAISREVGRISRIRKQAMEKANRDARRGR